MFFGCDAFGCVCEGRGTIPGEMNYTQNIKREGVARKAANAKEVV